MISDFQIALVGVTILILLAVFIYNRWQERKYRKRAESVFGSHHGDALLEVPARPAHPAAAPGERLEPLLGALPDYDDLELELNEGRAAPTVAQPLVPRETAAGIHAEIDTSALVLADNPITPEQYLGAVAATRTIGITLWEGLNDGLWEPIDEHGDEQYRELRAGLQLADRQGAIGRATIGQFQRAVQNFAAGAGAVLQCEDMDVAESRAAALDQFCAQSDVEVVIHVIGLNGVTFAPTKVRGQAEARGLKLLTSGEYALCNDLGAVLFTLRNMDPAQPPGINHQTAYFTGISFALDVPRTPDCVATFERMFSTALVFADVLQGEVVDDNKKTLTASTKKVIAESVGIIAAEMQAKGIEPGSPAALRLYS